MLSPTRSSTQTILKAVVTTASTMLQESASASVEQKEESNEAEVNIEICFAFYIDMI
jgi:hypothetical protein